MKNSITSSIKLMCECGPMLVAFYVREWIGLEKMSAIFYLHASRKVKCAIKSKLDP